MAIGRTEFNNCQKKLQAVRSSSNGFSNANNEKIAQMVQEQAANRKERDAKKKQEMYISKANRIEILKKERESKIQAELERRKKEQNDKKQKQTAELNKHKLKEQEAIALYASEIEAREKRAQEILSSSINKPKGKEYYKELEKLNTEFIKENQERLIRIKEHKRKQILDSHNNLKKANEKKNTVLQQYDTKTRKQAVMAQKSKEEILDGFFKMVKGNPVMGKDRQKIAETLKQLNDQLNLGLSLEFPPVRSPKKDDEDENDTSPK